MRTVESSRWWEELSALAVDGFTYLDYLTAIDRGTHLDLVAHVVNPDTVEHLLVVAALPGDSAVVDSLVPLHAGANWHEREAAEMFGITFTGHPDPRRLLLRDEGAAPPLRKSTAFSKLRAAPTTSTTKTTARKGVARVHTAVADW